ncbi:hypoxanthine phosphoribosyltransferase [Spiroplasma endosymbiont of Lonchoptera lutea]|uniref:hypoxanthine phosphoribosyltransferase n=1 Tax=Spiroplasma endosymbiont of Lonchoptera lutea TaxID=3066297 RepID=UPI0030CA70A1
MEKHPAVKEILFTHQQIIERTKALALEISKYYQANDSTIIILGILKGCIPFLAEFISHLTIECEIDFMTIASFHGGTEASSTPQIIMDINQDITNRDILIIEDIIESGASLLTIKEYLFLKGAKTVKMVTLLDKTKGRKVELNADWTGFKAPQEFLIGYGLDYQEKLRNLPYVAIADMEKIALLEKQ